MKKQTPEREKLSTLLLKVLYHPDTPPFLQKAVNKSIKRMRIYIDYHSTEILDVIIEGTKQHLATEKEIIGNNQKQAFANVDSEKLLAAIWKELEQQRLFNENK